MAEQFYLVLTLFSKNISTMLDISFYHYSPDRNIFDKLLFIVHSAFIHNISPLIHSYQYQTQSLDPPSLIEWHFSVRQTTVYPLIFYLSNSEEDIVIFFSFLNSDHIHILSQLLQRETRIRNKYIQRNCLNFRLLLVRKVLINYLLV